MGSPDAFVLSRLKEELIYAELFDSIAVAKSATFGYIEVFYNRKRRHSALCYLGPVEYERRCALPSVYFSWVEPESIDLTIRAFEGERRYGSVL
ncbi:IS3 family transposase [Marinobacter subterrani]|uniref:Integrase core domain n=1 Tax=Marinobacter subterrani TaxID=1658765 RepID=A0A0J7JEV0_9GAMM|nr:Integrase core domain [Marinobacter subterrani]